MKKTITAATVILVTTFIASTAFAWCGGGSQGRNAGNCPVYSDNPANTQAFYDNTTDLRASLAADRAERAALMAAATPDAKRVRALTENIVKQQNALRKQAAKYNVTLGSMGQGSGYCDNDGMGRHHRGRMMNQ